MLCLRGTRLDGWLYSIGLIRCVCFPRFIAEHMFDIDDDNDRIMATYQGSTPYLGRSRSLVLQHLRIGGIRVWVTHSGIGRRVSCILFLRVVFAPRVLLLRKHSFKVCNLFRAIARVEMELHLLDEVG